MIKTWMQKSGWLAAAALSVLLPIKTAQAAAADLADRPLATTNSGVVVRSNLMFVLDDSGSMNWDFLPDTAPTQDVCFG